MPMVTETSEWPKRSWATLGLRPMVSINVAHVCLRSWNEPSSTIPLLGCLETPKRRVEGSINRHTCDWHDGSPLYARVRRNRTLQQERWQIRNWALEEE